MAATTLGTVGIWGITSAETTLGIIIEELNDETSMDTGVAKDRYGNDTGYADYNEKLDITIKGAVTSSNGYTGKVSASITLSNTITGTHLQSSSSGMTIVRSVARSRKNTDWQGVEIKAQLLPNFPAGGS